MTDDQLRALVRDAVARHMGGRPSTPMPIPSTPMPILPETAMAPAAAPHASSWSAHPSHHQYLALVNASTACVIEPSVGCDHCGYCRSHGH